MPNNALMIVESPNKIKKITHYLHEIGLNDVKVMASVGHIRDLPGNQMGIEIDNKSFLPEYIISDTKKQVVAKLKSAIQDAETIYLATDPDREGESIAWHLQDALAMKKLNKNILRVKFNEINKKSIQEAIKNASTVDMHLVAAQEARRVLDRLIGYTVSPRLGGKLSAGRVQSPALRLIVEREDEIITFKPTTHYDVRANMTAPQPWSALWIHEKYREKDQPYYLNKDIAEKIAELSRLTVKSVDRKERAAKAPAPFTTSSLQQAASSKLKISPEETMALAQNLFAQGAITYHRTDSPNLSEDAIKNVASTLSSMNIKALDNPNKWPAKSGAQEAHEAIRPVDCMIKVAGETEKEQALYDMIRTRTLACQMPDAIFDVMDIILESDVTVPNTPDKALFKAHGEVLTQKSGWMGLMGKAQESEDDDEIHPALPIVNAGDSFTASGSVLTKATTPPNRYTEASLVKKLENLEIGRPSTYASILKNIKSRDYVLINKKRQLEPTPKGTGLISELKLAGFSFLKYDWTKGVEKRLDDIAAAKDKYRNVVSQTYDVLMAEMSGLPERKSFNLSTLEDANCSCGGLIGESDKAYQCQNCKAIVWKVISGRAMSKNEAIELLNGKTLPLSGFISKAKKPFDTSLIIKDGKIEFIFEESEKTPDSKTLFCQCTCGGDVYNNKLNWACESCKSTVWKEISGKKVHDKDAKILFKGESVEMTGLTSKSGKTFSCLVVMDAGKTKFVFK